MANPEQLEVLKHGSVFWNRWRVLTYAEIKTEISGSYPFIADLSGADLGGENLSRADLSGANLSHTNLLKANLSDVNFSGANLSDSNLSGADLSGADLSYSSLLNANLSGANLRDANLYAADMRYATILGSQLSGANMNHVTLSGNIFAGINLSEIKGLETVRHAGPSEISLRTIYLSKDPIPDVFLRGCEVPEDFIAYRRSLVVQPGQFYSSFISYTHQDQDFARRLYWHMKDMKLSVWCAIEDMKGGQDIHEQVYRAIQIHDKVLLVLSEESLRSNWVVSEILRARKAELEQNRRKLFPIRLVDYQTIRDWECFDVDSGEDLAREVRKYFIPDFSNWKDAGAFKSAFDNLLRDLELKT